MRSGLFKLEVRALPLVVASILVAGTARADDDLVLDLGGMTLQTRHVVHGSFTQGAMPAESAHDRDEEPAHQVTITRDFWMGKFPVTREQFAKFVADTRYVTDAEKGQSGSGWDGKALVQRKDFNWKNPGFTQTDEHPVVLVSYGDANAFTGWASRKTGKRVRLPTEAEWEFAARGGTATPWYVGSTEAEAATIGWFKGNAGNGTRPVGQKKANPLGLFDMSGNVFQWCRDIYGPYREVAAVDPELMTNGNEPERRVLRGGSWLRDVKRSRSGARYRNAPGSRNADNGFRVVVTNEEAVAPGVTGTAPDFAPASPLRAPGAPGPGAASSGAAPLADREAPRIEPIARPSEGVSWSLLVASPLAAASAVVAWMLLRRKRRPGGAVTPSGASTRLGDDGFFVRAPLATPGSRVRYECTVNGTQVTDVVPLAGAETFVYTGSPPTGLRIVEIVAAPAGAHRAAGRPPVAAMVDPGLVPPSSRPRPPPVPARRAAPSVPAQIITQVHVTHPDSHNPMRVPFISDPPSSVVPAASEVTSSSAAPPGDRSPPSAPPPSAPTAGPDASTSDGSNSDRSASSESPLGDASSEGDAPSKGEAFLGNPRAY